MEKFKYVKPTKEWEEKAIDFIHEFEEMNSPINGTNRLHKYLDSYDAWLDKIEQDRVQPLSENAVPAETFFFVRDNDNKIIGMINIRLALNEKLKKLGGHIGYCIRPTERRKGYNKINLYMGLLYCQEQGIKEVLMDCEKDNVASAKTMQALGGKLIKEWYEDDKYHCVIQDYVIDVDKTIEDNRSVYENFIVENEPSPRR